jgi:hypothetical protein
VAVPLAPGAWSVAPELGADLAAGLRNCRAFLGPLSNDFAAAWSDGLQADFRAGSKKVAVADPTFAPGECVEEMLAFTRIEFDAAKPETVSVYFGSDLLLSIKRPQKDDFIKGIPGVKLKTEQQLDRGSEIRTQINTQLPYWADALNLRPQRHPYTMLLLEMMWAYIGTVSLKIKSVFECRRPSEYDPSIQTAVTPPWHSSFHSGHSAEAWFFNQTLQRLVMDGLQPARQEELKQRLNRLSWRVGDNREVAGVHFAVDSAAGRALGTTVAKYLLDRVEANIAQVQPRNFDGTVLKGAATWLPEDALTDEDAAAAADADPAAVAAAAAVVAAASKGLTSGAATDPTFDRPLRVQAYFSRAKAEWSRK